MGLSILLVEDEEKIREHLRRLLAKENHVVMGAGSCAEAIELMKHHRVDLAIIDWALPDCLGTSLVPLLPRGTAVFFLSGYSVDTIPDEWRYPRYREIDFHQKPIYWPVLKSAIVRLHGLLEAAKEHTPLPSSVKRHL